MNRGLFILVGLLLLTTQAFADYNANATGQIKWVKIYNNDVIYFEITDQQPVHTQYNYFAVRGDSVISAEARSRYYAMLLTAKVSGKKVNVGYDNTAAGSYLGAVEVHAIELID